jgi:4-hydroxythreonine-4-phosphate dehydrogenase
LSKGDVDVLVTAPIDKENIQSDEFNFPGHTEYLEEKFGNGKSLMFLLNDDLRVAVVTGHIPVTKVAEELTTEKISKKLDILNESLKNDFLIRAPKIAVLGLNPHAGDNGVIGDEEKTIIIPAINAAKDKNMLAYGPFPADGFFGSEAYKKYDAVLAMYHDQGLVPFKTLSFNAGVNYTAGLSVVRTSPDHGTAYDIAGRNIANEASFRKAIYTAIDIFRVRSLNKELNKNPLKLKSFKSER